MAALNLEASHQEISLVLNNNMAALNLEAVNMAALNLEASHQEISLVFTYLLYNLPIII
jgi:hypothetical protein